HVDPARRLHRSGGAGHGAALRAADHPAAVEPHPPLRGRPRGPAALERRPGAGGHRQPVPPGDPRPDHLRDRPGQQRPGVPRPRSGGDRGPGRPGDRRHDLRRRPGGGRPDRRHHAGSVAAAAGQRRAGDVGGRGGGGGRRRPPRRRGPGPAGGRPRGPGPPLDVGAGLPPGAAGLILRLRFPLRSRTRRPAVLVAFRPAAVPVAVPGTALVVTGAGVGAVLLRRFGVFRGGERRVVAALAVAVTVGVVVTAAPVTRLLR